MKYFCSAINDFMIPKTYFYISMIRTWKPVILARGEKAKSWCFQRQKLHGWWHFRELFRNNTMQNFVPLRYGVHDHKSRKVLPEITVLKNFQRKVKFCKKFIMNANLKTFILLAHGFQFLEECFSKPK